MKKKNFFFQLGFTPSKTEQLVAWKRKRSTRKRSRKILNHTENCMIPHAIFLLFIFLLIGSFSFSLQ